MKYITRDIKAYVIVVKGIDVKNDSIIELSFTESKKPENETKYLASITTEEFKPSFITSIMEFAEKRGMTLETFMKYSVPMKDYRRPDTEKVLES